MIDHKHLLNCFIKKSNDYTPYGDIERWSTDDPYPDCSCGCKWFLIVEGSLGADWGICCKVGSQRCGLLTFEHQAGFGCFES